MVITGEVAMDQHLLQRRDALGLWDTESFELKAEQDSELLLIEVPMIF